MHNAPEFKFKQDPSCLTRTNYARRTVSMDFGVYKPKKGEPNLQKKLGRNAVDFGQTNWYNVTPY